MDDTNNSRKTFGFILWVIIFIVVIAVFVYFIYEWYRRRENKKVIERHYHHYYNTPPPSTSPNTGHGTRVTHRTVVGEPSVSQTKTVEHNV